MMKKAVFLLLIFMFPFFSFSQKINNCGHIIIETNTDKSFKYIENKNTYQVIVNNMVLEGNSLLETTNGYLTITNLEENVPSKIRLYNANGELLFIKDYKQVINLITSENKYYVAFYNAGYLTVLNIQSLKEFKYASSLIFNIDNDGNPAYGNNIDNTLFYKNTNYKFENQLSKLLFFNDKLIVFTTDKMYLIENGVSQLVYTFNSRFFDAAVYNNKLYFVNRIENKEGFIFTLFETANFNEFVELQKENYNFNSISEPSLIYDTLKNKGYLHEPIRGPIRYNENNVQYPIGNSYAEIQDYGSPQYLHPGVDFLGNPNENVYAVKAGVVKAILTTSGSLHWRIAISNNATSGESVGYLYAHTNQYSIPYLVGDIVSQGSVVGTLVEWPIYNFTHCHFARIQASGATWDGNWWTINNPLIDVTNIVDNTTPVFMNAIGSNKFAIRKKANGSYIQPDSVYGNVEFITKIYDQVNSTWKLDVYKLRYSMHPFDNANNIIFDNLAFTYDMPLDEYITNNYTTLCLNTIYSRDVSCFSIGNYDDRDYYQIVTNSNGDDSISSADQLCSFNTVLYPDGQYYFKVTAWDASNNVKSDSMLIHIKNHSNKIDESALNKAIVSIFPNPNHGKFNLIFSDKTMNDVSISIIDVLGNVVSEKSYNSINNMIDISKQPKGIYFLKIKGLQINKTFKVVYN